MISKLEFLNLSYYSFLNPIDKQNEICCKYGMYGISLYPSHLNQIDNKNLSSNIYVSLDSMNPKFSFKNYIYLIDSMKEYDSLIKGYNIPIDILQKIDIKLLNELIEYCSWRGSVPRIGIDLSKIYNETDLKNILCKIEHPHYPHINLYYSNKKDYDSSNLMILSGWILNNTTMNLSMFGKFSNKILDYPIFKHNRVKSIGMSMTSIYNFLLEGV